jgi:hypothetical protein
MVTGWSKSVRPPRNLGRRHLGGLPRHRLRDPNGIGAYVTSVRARNSFRRGPQLGVIQGNSVVSHGILTALTPTLPDDVTHVGILDRVDLSYLDWPFSPVIKVDSGWALEGLGARDECILSRRPVGTNESG